MCSFKIKSIIIVISIFFTLTIDAKMIRDVSVVDNQVIFDTTSNLMWQDDNDATLNTKSWIDAITYCEGLSKKSYINWRLPNINELRTISDDNKYNPSISNVFQNIKSNRYWSSTTASSKKNYAWVVNFNTSSEDYISKSTEIYVRCVRDVN